MKNRNLSEKSKITVQVSVNTLVGIKQGKLTK